MRLQGDAATQFGNNLRRMGGVPSRSSFGQPRQNGGINPGGFGGGSGGGPYSPNAKPGQISGAQPDFSQGAGAFNPSRFRSYPGGGPGGGINPGGFGGPIDRWNPPQHGTPGPGEDPGGFLPFPRGNPGPLPPPPPPPRWGGEIEGGPFGPPRPRNDDYPQDPGGGGLATGPRGNTGPLPPPPGPQRLPFNPDQPWGNDYFGWLQKRLVYGSPDDPQIPTENPIFPIGGGDVRTVEPAWLSQAGLKRPNMVY